MHRRPSLVSSLDIAVAAMRLQRCLVAAPGLSRGAKKNHVTVATRKWCKQRHLRHYLCFQCVYKNAAPLIFLSENRGAAPYPN